MTPNLTSARQAIQAELSHARQGAAFYTARVEALETALSQLESVDTDDASLLGQDEHAATRKTGAKKKATKQAAKRGRPARQSAAMEEGGRRQAASGTQRTRGGRKASARGEQAGLPTTGADFWLELVTGEPQSAVDIANSAAARLGLGPDQKTQIQKLKQRVAPALATLVTSKKIQHEGAGRQRRYFRGAAEQAE